VPSEGRRGHAHGGTWGNAAHGGSSVLVALKIGTFRALQRMVKMQKNVNKRSDDSPSDRTSRARVHTDDLELGRSSEPERASGSSSSVDSAVIKSFIAEGWVVSSESPPPPCGPHLNCFGGTLLNGSYAKCERRIGSRQDSHKRNVVCLSSHTFFRCATCPNVVHDGCWVPNAGGKSFTRPSTLVSFTCTECHSQCTRGSSAQPSAPSTDTDAASSAKPSAPSADTDAGRGEASIPTVVSFMSRIAMKKLMRESDWKVRSSTGNRKYFECKLNKCDVKFKALQMVSEEHDSDWIIKGMPSHHSCGGDSKKSQLETGLHTHKISLPESVVKKIEELGASGIFTSTQIQQQVCFSHDSLLVDTKLIQNISTRVRQKLFGHRGDLINLLEQQKVGVRVYTIVPVTGYRLVEHWAMYTNS
jgi:hypothetical protein